MTEAAASPTVPDLDAPSPPTFDALPLSPETRGALERMGYTHPTPVQRAVFEPATGGRDLVVQARTGTGKTAAFGLPIVEHGVRRSVKAVQALCLCPTRELALQVSNEIGRLGEGRGVSLVAVYGGAPMGRQIDALAAGAQVVVGTPGRVLDHLRRGTLDPSAVRLLVLDEADEMLSMGFERELHAILDVLPKERQTLLFSATVPPDIERIARERLRSPEFITLSSDAVGALSVAHYVYFVTEDKLQTLLRVLEVDPPESAIVFCNTKAETEVVAQGLARRGYKADWLNGDLPQNERESVMKATRAGELRFLVATDVAARGIDISHLTHVINYDFPDSAEAYVHRTGRTGRAGRTGTALSLVRAQDVGNLYYLRLTYQIRPIEKQIPTTLELKTRQEADLLDALIGSLRDVPVHADDLLLARRLLTHDRAEHVLGALLRDRLGERETAAAAAASARRARTTAAPELEGGEGSSEGPLRRSRRGSRDSRDSREPSRGRDDRGRSDDRSGPPREARPALEPRPATEVPAALRPSEGSEAVESVAKAVLEAPREGVEAVSSTSVDGAREGAEALPKPALGGAREGAEALPKPSVSGARDVREGRETVEARGASPRQPEAFEGREGAREGREGPREGRDRRDRRDAPRDRRDAPREARDGAPRESTAAPPIATATAPVTAPAITTAATTATAVAVPRETPVVPREGAYGPGRDVAREGRDVAREGRDVAREGRDVAREGRDILREGREAVARGRRERGGPPGPNAVPPTDATNAHAVSETSATEPPPPAPVERIPPTAPQRSAAPLPERLPTPERAPTPFAERSAAPFPERSPGSFPERSAAPLPERSPGAFPERSPGSFPERSPALSRAAVPADRATPADRPSGAQTPGEGGRRGAPAWDATNNVRPGSEPRRPRSRGRVASDDLSQAPVRYFTSDANGEPPPVASPDASSSILLTWTPPVEEGDDRPLLGAISAADEPEDEGEPTAEERLDYAEVFVDVGRRDGARPSDIQKVLRDRGGISRRETGHIRVRDKHAFVLVRRELLDRALEALQGSIIAGRTVKAEPARERPNDAQG